MDETIAAQMIPFDADARMAITIETGVAEQRYQGIVALEGESLADAFTAYFERSEQLQTRLLLACDGGLVAAGLLLQKLPMSTPANAEQDPDGWNRLGHLLATLSPAELLGSDPLELLRLLFAEETVALTHSQSVRFACSCSRERVGDVLQSLGREECAAALTERQVIDVTCEFCGQTYTFDAVEVESLFHTGIQPAPPQLM
jgi:molecular chaperone Hsp33